MTSCRRGINGQDCYRIYIVTSITSHSLQTHMLRSLMPPSHYYLINSLGYIVLHETVLVCPVHDDLIAFN